MQEYEEDEERFSNISKTHCTQSTKTGIDSMMSESRNTTIMETITVYQ